jgi:hypothetical protein
LDHVLSLLEVTDQRQRRAKRGILEPPSEFDEGFDLATARSTYPIGVVHSGLLTHKVPESRRDF